MVCCGTPGVVDVGVEKYGGCVAVYTRAGLEVKILIAQPLAAVEGANEADGLAGGFKASQFEYLLNFQVQAYRVLCPEGPDEVDGVCRVGRFARDKQVTVDVGVVKEGIRGCVFGVQIARGRERDIDKGGVY